MTSMQAGIQWLMLWGALGLSGYAGTPPKPVLSQADLAVQQAIKSKVLEYVSLELYTAREQLSGAQNAMQQKEYTQARWLAERPLVNAQLAEN